MDLGISGQTALVLGGTQGLGLACAQALAAAGVRVLANGRSAAAWEAARDTLPGASFVQGDLGKSEERLRIISIAEKLGPVSILVTNAGGPPTGQFEELTSEQWRTAFETNFLGILEITRALLPGMRARRYGRVINVTSFVVKELYPNMSLSNSFRVGLTGATASFRASWTRARCSGCSATAPGAAVKPKHKSARAWRKACRCNASARPPISARSAPFLPRATPITSPGKTSASMAA